MYIKNTHGGLYFNNTNSVIILIPFKDVAWTCL